MLEKKQVKAVIGISGYARSGKDTLASIIRDSLRSSGIRTKVFSFAHSLKSDIDDFCKSKIGISSFTEVTEEKSKIRPILIAYGQVQRNMSNGLYWINKLKPEIDSFFADSGSVAIISDLRFKEFEVDEIDLIKYYRNNMIITVSRIMENGIMNTAAHESEAENLPRISRIADYELVWNTNENKDELKTQSSKCIELIFSKFFNI
jgi:hypothetical protein